jgi:pimeloyl-ACP methyl ester carboxylesterase
MTLHVETAGRGGPVLLLHAGVCDSRMWDPQWDAVAAAHYALRYDLRGFGRSPLPPAPFSHARDLLELLDRLGIGRAALVAASFSGRVALEVALVRPELVDALVLVGATLPDHDWSQEVRAFMAEEDHAFERGDLDAAVEANLRTWVDGRGRDAGMVDPAVRERVRQMQRQAFQLQLAAGEEADEQPLVTDVGERLGEVAAPSLIVVGEHDVADVHAIAERLAGQLPDARRVVVPGVAHLPSMERPAEVNDLVLGFLAGTRGRRAQPGST